MYEIIFSAIARKKLKKLDKHTQARVLSSLERIRVRPELFVRRLVDLPYYRLRVGDYRVILDIKKDKLIIFVVTIGPRKKIYKSLY